MMIRALVLLAVTGIPVSLHAETCKPPNVARVVVVGDVANQVSRLVCPVEGACQYSDTAVRTMPVCLSPEEHAAALKRGE